MEAGGGEPGDERDVEEVDSDAFNFRATYSDGSYGGRSLSIEVYSKAKPKHPIVHTLYQLSRSENPQNNYGDGPEGHGFTGLVYVSDPFSPAELQYYCWHIGSQKLSPLPVDDLLSLSDRR